MTMQQPEPQGIKFVGDLRLAFRNPQTGILGGFVRLHSDKLEIKTPVDEEQKISHQLETHGQAIFTAASNKPAEVSINLDEATGNIFAAQLSGTLTDINEPAAALAGIDVDVKPGFWAPIGHRHLDLTSVTVTNAGATTTYVKDVDYEISPRVGMIYVPEGGAIAAGTVKLTCGKNAYTGVSIAGGTQPQYEIQVVLDGMNLSANKRCILEIPKLIVTSQDAMDFLGRKLLSVPIKGKANLASGWTAPFKFELFD